MISFGDVLLEQSYDFLRVYRGSVATNGSAVLALTGYSTGQVAVCFDDTALVGGRACETAAGGGWARATC